MSGLCAARRAVLALDMPVAVVVLAHLNLEVMRSFRRHFALSSSDRFVGSLEPFVCVWKYVC